MTAGWSESEVFDGNNGEDIVRWVESELGRHVPAAYWYATRELSIGLPSRDLRLCPGDYLLAGGGQVALGRWAARSGRVRMGALPSGRTGWRGMRTPVIADHDVTVYQGDARDVLATLPAGSVQCVVTSPPYYGLRDYGTGTWGGGDPTCDHAMPTSGSHLNANFNERWGNSSGQRKQETAKVQQFRDVCGKCGATRTDRQIGLEPSPAEYVEQLRAVFGEARRVLADDGVMWLNIGDSYVSAAGGAPQSGNIVTNGGERFRRPRTRDYVPPKNLLGVPWRVAFALQDDGWTLRAEVIWAKRNCLPEAVTDRPTRSHEQVFLLSKSRRYWYDADAIREESDPEQEAHNQRYAREYTVHTARAATTGQPGNVNNLGVHTRPGKGGRNARSVWTISAQPTPYAHFATMPPELVRRCILAGCPENRTVLDPFAGSGTTLMVARKLGRRSVGVELNPGYVDIIRRRIGQEPLMFGEAPA